MTDMKACLVTAADLIPFINNHPQFKELPMKYLFIELLKRDLIQPSEIIDAYSKVMQDKLMVAETHYDDACISALQMEGNDWSKKENTKKIMDRFFYNTSFSKKFPNLTGRNIDEKDRKELSDSWLAYYGFRPEDE